MQIVRTLAHLRQVLDDLNSKGASLGFVPTMGALHAGHLALVEEARAQTGVVICSIFVNPLQFNRAEDLARYPRHEEEDLALLKPAGVDLVFMPEVGDLLGGGWEPRCTIWAVWIRFWRGPGAPGIFKGWRKWWGVCWTSSLAPTSIWGSRIISNAWLCNGSWI